MDASVMLTLEATGEELARGAEAVNAALAGTGVWVAPCPLDGEPADILALLNLPVLSAEENARVKGHFLLPRERCLEVIGLAGRTPLVPGGGSMTAYSVSQDVQYPKLWVIAADAKYSDYHAYHQNLAEDGTGSDEVGQVLSGALMRYRYDVLGGVVLTMSCGEGMGWLYTFSGALPHGGILRDTTVGSKILVQVLGPERFWARVVG